MNRYSLAIFILVASCQQPSQQANTIDTVLVRDTVVIKDTVAVNNSAKAYGNARFKDVTVEKVGVNKYLVKGKAQVFEAAFSWVVEDGHNELKKGFETTDAGAPAWGDFAFIVQVARERKNSTLHLLLFEASAKDGSRQHQLPVPLP